MKYLRLAWEHLFPIPNVGQTEAFLARALLTGAIIHFLPSGMDQITQPVPVGLAHWFDLTWMSNAQSFAVFRFVSFTVAFWFASGVALPVSLPILTLLHVLPYTLYNSQGHPHHGYQIMSLSLLGMSVATITMAVRGRTKAMDTLRKPLHLLLTLAGAAAAAWIFREWLNCVPRAQVGQAVNGMAGAYFGSFLHTTVDLIVVVALGFVVQQVSTRRNGIALPYSELNAWLLIAPQFMIGGAYLISVCSKMIRSKGEWLINSHYVALDFVKTLRQSYYSDLDPAFAHEPAGVVWLMNHPNMARLFFDGGVMLETALVLAVGTRRLALIFGICTIVMHQSIEALMTLTFYTHEMMVLIYFVNLPFLLACLLDRKALLGRL
jgi:hypothetical protein